MPVQIDTNDREVDKEGSRLSTFASGDLVKSTKGEYFVYLLNSSQALILNPSLKRIGIMDTEYSEDDLYTLTTKEIVLKVYNRQ
jgi:hypothetical protein